jgi:hypothetical protein
VTIGNSVKSIGYDAFSGCTGLKSVNVDANNPVYASVDGVLFNKKGSVLVVYPSGKTGFYTIPNSVTSIGDGAFYGCTSLTSVTIPNSVTSIGGYTFYGCTGLTSVTIPNSVTSIWERAFYGCSGLTSVTIPNSVTSIWERAFYGCSGLTSVTIPNRVTSIGYDAFSGCTGLKSVNVDANNPVYASVDGVLFNKNGSVLVVYPAGKTGFYTIPNSVTIIGSYAFYGCTGLTSVTIPNSVTSIWERAFYGCTGLTSVTIPNRVTSIGGYTFYGCTGLTNVTIGNSVKSIGYDAFYGCSGLQGVYFLGNPPSLGADAFIGATAATVYFNPGTKGWTDRFGGRPTKMWDQQPQPRATNLGFKSGQFGFDITAMSGQPFVIEAATNLVQPVWKPLSTNTAINTVSFTDPQWKEYPTRLYRIRTP